MSRNKWTGAENVGPTSIVQVNNAQYKTKTISTKKKTDIVGADSKSINNLAAVHGIPLANFLIQSICIIPLHNVIPVMKVSQTNALPAAHVHTAKQYPNLVHIHYSLESSAYEFFARMSNRLAPMHAVKSVKRGSNTEDLQVCCCLYLSRCLLLHCN